MSAKIGIALGAGGARGLAHAGVLKVLDEAGIPIHCITGTSIGAVVGAMYAQNPNAADMIEKIKETIKEDLDDRLGINVLETNAPPGMSFFRQTGRNIKKRIIINLAQSRVSLVKEFHLEEILSKFISNGDIEQARLPLGIVATSLRTGNDIFFTQGDIIGAVAASSSIPGILGPFYLDDDILTDGAVGCPVPVEYLPQMGANITIGVEVGMRKYPRMDALNVIEVITRANMITSRRLAGKTVAAADVAICPDTKDITWSEFNRVEELIEAGMASAREKIPEIRKAIRNKMPLYKRLF